MINDVVHEYGPIKDDVVPIRKNVYRRRWYIVIIFAIFAMEQGAVSNTWGPVADTVNEVYGWSTGTIAILSAWNNIIFLIFFLPMVKLMMSYGLRFVTLLCSCAMALSTGIRCIPVNDFWTRIFAHISAILCGFANTLGMIGPTAVSVTWFPVHERTLATAIISVSNNNFANALSFILAKVMVEDFNDNMTLLINSTVSPEVKSHNMLMFKELKNFMLTEFVICAVVLAAIVIYFPRRPGNPPSSSAASSRVDYKNGLLQSIRNKNLWLLMVPYGLPLGMQPAFISVMDSILLPYGISQDTSNLIGFYSALASAFGGISFSWIADRLKRRTKGLLIFCISIGGASYGWFLLMVNNVLPSNSVCIFMSLIMGGMFSNGAVPLIYELACEITYPVSEEVTTGFMTALNNLAAVTLLAVVSIESLGKSWVLWCLTVSFLISIPVLIVMRADYRRIDMDCTIDDEDVHDHHENQINEQQENLIS